MLGRLSTGSRVELLVDTPFLVRFRFLNTASLEARFDIVEEVEREARYVRKVVASKVGGSFNRAAGGTPREVKIGNGAKRSRRGNSSTSKQLQYYHRRGQ